MIESEKIAKSLLKFKGNNGPYVINGDNLRERPGMQQSKVLDYYLNNDPLRRDLTNEERARLLSLVEVRHYGIDDSIYQPKMRPFICFL